MLRRRFYISFGAFIGDAIGKFKEFVNVMQLMEFTVIIIFHSYLKGIQYMCILISKRRSLSR